MQNFETINHDQQAAYPVTVASLNDRLRANLDGPAPNIVVMTTGILAEVDRDPTTCAAKQSELQRIIAEYADFSEDNDPHGERDFGAFTWQGVRCFWKIDHYDKAADCGSPDPSNPAVTCRVLTILRADEY